MRILQYGDRTATLSSEELGVILNRFDVDKARLGGSTWTIDARCVCQSYEEDCQGCPFWQLNGRLGCMAWMRDRVGGKLVCHLHQDRIEWQDVDNDEARKQVQLLREIFANLPTENKPVVG